MFFLTCLAIGLVVIGQLSQLINAMESATHLQTLMWVQGDESRQEMLSPYTENCFGQRGEFGENDLEESISKVMSNEDCAKSVDAQELYAVIKKAQDTVEIAWPLSLL